MFYFVSENFDFVKLCFRKPDLDPSNMWDFYWTPTNFKSCYDVDLIKFGGYLKIMKTHEHLMK